MDHPSAIIVREDVTAVLQGARRQLVTRWAALVEEAQPQLSAVLGDADWDARAADALDTLGAELANPASLARPVLAAVPEARVAKLAARIAAPDCLGAVPLHTLQGTYFLLQEAVDEAIATAFAGDQRAIAHQLVDRFFKQLAMAMTEITTRRLTVPVEVAVAERTHELEELLRKEGEFLGFISHEVRTGLTAILGACDFLSEINPEPLTTTQTRYIRMIERSGELIHVLVNDILDYAKLESGRVKLRFEPINLREVATDALALLESKWAPKGLEMVLAIPAELPDVAGDRIRLQQILLNLVANAIRFSPMGGKVVLRGGLIGAQEWVEVEDQGPGVPEADRTKIFDRFEQLDNAISRGEGTGLGLPIVKLLTELHGGVIEVRDPGAPVGGLFRVTLPVPSPHDERVAQQTG
jgi:signal transduction histidine kinase